MSLTHGPTALTPTTTEPANWLGKTTLSLHPHLGILRANQKGEESLLRASDPSHPPALQSWVPCFWFFQIRMVGGGAILQSAYLNPCAATQRPPGGRDEHRLQTLKGNERPVQIWNHQPRAKVENYRAALRGRGHVIEGSTAAIYKMVPFWTEWFHLPARVPNLEPGGKWQSYQTRAWKYECLLSPGLDSVSSNEGEDQIPQFSPTKDSLDVLQ